MHRIRLLLPVVLLLFPFFGAIEGFQECFKPLIKKNGCTYECKNPEYIFICEDDGVHASKCNRTCRGGQCMSTPCTKVSCETEGPDQWEQNFETLCLGRSMQMHQGSSSRGLRFRQPGEEKRSTGYSIYLNTLVPILAGGIVMGGILLLVRLCGRRGQVRMVESPTPREEQVPQPQIRYPCQLLPMQFSSLQLNPQYLGQGGHQYLGQGGQFPNIQLAQVAGMSPVMKSKSPISMGSNKALIPNEERPSTSSSPPSYGQHKEGMPQDQMHYESDFTDLPPAYDDVMQSAHPTIKEDDKNKPQ